MDYIKARNYINESVRFGGKIGLSAIRKLTQLLGNPQDSLKFIHIAGTNGKGSVGAYIDSVLRETKYKIGRFVSPTLYEYRERIQINGEYISEETFGRLMDRIVAAMKEMEQSGEQLPSPFEIETALAFLYFKENNCDLVMLECGMGGKLDATNIIKNTELAVITSISLDHMEYLGNTLKEIAEKKAGIIKPGASVVTCLQAPEAAAVIHKKCRENGNLLAEAKYFQAKVIHSDLEKLTFEYLGRRITVHLTGACQLENAVLAMAGIQALADRGYQIEEDEIIRGFEKTRWPGRFSILRKNPYFIADGAHNPDAAEKLKTSLNMYFPNKKFIFIMAMLKDKQYQTISSMLAPMARQIICTQTPENDRALSAEELRDTVKEYNPSVLVRDTLAEAVDTAMKTAGQDEVIVAFGSLSFMGELTKIVEEYQEEEVLSLSEVRKNIDIVDRQLVRLFEQRLKLSEMVAGSKLKTGKAVLDREREKEKLDTLEKLAEDPAHQSEIRELFHEVMAVSRKFQYDWLGQHGRGRKREFTQVDSLPVKGARVVFQGVRGAYSFAAMNSFFGEDIESFHVETWREAMEAIKNKEADYAVLPIENSTAGIVADIYDLLVEYDHCIVGEQIVPVEHALMGVKGSTLKDIKTVYSHPQALAQCRKFLDAHPEWRIKPYLNTAMAAQKIRDDNDISKAAIASPLAASCFGLDILQPQVYSGEENATRFIIVAKEKVFVKNSEKVSVCFEISHVQGSLYNMLSHFIYNDLNMTKIESRPIPEKKWGYRFFIDFEGSLDDDKVQTALRGIKEEAAVLQVLGNY